jgi:fibronectin-binding autotransporter adhesin
MQSADFILRFAILTPRLRRMAAVLIGFLLAGAASAQTTLWWDINGNTAGSGGPTPSGTWDTNNGNKVWSTNSGGTSKTAWASGDAANFSAGTDATGAFTVTVSGTQNAASITVDEGSPTLATGAVNFTGAAPNIFVASGSTLTFGTALSSATNNLSLGSGTYTGATVFSANTSLSGTVNLGGGTLSLAGTSYTFGTLNITGNSIIDFAGATTLNVTTLTVSAGVTLTIQNWTQASDFFYAANWTGATQNVMGSAPMNQISFNGFTASQSGWDSYDNQIRPNVPEPRTYGALLLGALMGMFAWRRLVRRPAGHTGIPADF